MRLPEFAKQLNHWGKKKTPFLFLIDFEMEKPLAFLLDDIDPKKLLFDINGKKNYACPVGDKENVKFIKKPLPISEYKGRFDEVYAHLLYGDSYLTNLTIRTPVYTPMTLRDIFFVSRAKYKLHYDDAFSVFSPETFVKIRNGKISAYPMKGTIDASLSDAAANILADRKEMAEHVTIVDLIRNDLSAVAKNVRVERFRYLEDIRTNHKDLLQVSSEVTGELPDDYEERLGDILLSLLPAGSVSGAPKRKTVEIIRHAEGEPRGYYTGVMGIFDGQLLESGVMIRFVEQADGKFYYRSGGGITAQSDLRREYEEAIDKVYVPLN